MLFIPVRHLQEGMVLAQDIYFEVGGIPLLTRGQVIKEGYITKLQSLDIMGVYIESKISNDIKVNSMIDDKLKREALMTVKCIFEDFSRTNKLAIETVSSILDIAEKLVIDVLSNEEILINLIDLKGFDDYTYQHSLCVAIIAITLGIKMGFNESKLNDLAISGLMHDIGKMSISKEILNKPSRLTEEEFEIMKKHPENAVLLLESLKMFPTVILQGIESHHEKYDGTGYPKQLKGENIPLFGRILAVADVYDALTSDRPYRKASFPNEVIEFMMGNTDVHFDREVLSAFLKSVAAYPAGMLVSLSSGQTAIVIKNNAENTLRPIVRVFHEDGSGHIDMDLLHDQQYYNLTIIGMGYSDDTVDYSAIGNAGTEDED